MPVLAIDQGTTSTRALRVDDHGNAAITLAVTHRQYYPQPGWVEHDANELIASIEACLDSVDGIDAVGIDNQGESCLAWDADSKAPVGPVIVWQDDRTADEIERLKRQGHEALVRDRSGLPLESYFSASKLAWIVKHNDEAARLARRGKLRLGTTDAFFLDRLAGRFATDITTASRTALLDLVNGNWDEDLCRLFGVPIAALPEIVSTTGDLGRIARHGRELPVTASVVDQQAALYGHGCRAPGDLKITFGTGAFVLAIAGDRVLRSPEQGLLPTVAWQFAGQRPTYALDGGVYSAGSAIDWGRKLGLFDDFDEIARFDRPAAIDRDLVFVPALAGLACPHWDRRAGGLWLGMSLDTDRRDLMQALLEGVALRAAEVVDAMGRLVDIGDRVSVDGGVSANPYFCQFLADLLRREVAVKSMAELTALGTAQLAGAVSVDSESDDGTTRRYRPASDRGDAQARFAEAITRSRGWRRQAQSG